MMNTAAAESALQDLWAALAAGRPEGNGSSICRKPGLELSSAQISRLTPGSAAVWTA